jgi:hypothetical protein
MQSIAIYIIKKGTMNMRACRKTEYIVSANKSNRNISPTFSKLYMGIYIKL